MFVVCNQCDKKIKFILSYLFFNYRWSEYLFNSLMRLTTKKISRPTLLTSLYRPVVSVHKGQIRQKTFPGHDVIMKTDWCTRQHIHSDMHIEIWHPELCHICHDVVRDNIWNAGGRGHTYRLHTSCYHDKGNGRLYACQRIITEQILYMPLWIEKYHVMLYIDGLRQECSNSI